MGLYNDSVGYNRLEWKYTYKADELVKPAEKLLKYHTEKEMEARTKTAELLKDVSVNQNDPRFNELKREIATHGSLKEQCQVFVHEFSRDRAREFELGLGDITFFGLAEDV
jgi:hypothetical protein